MKKILTIVFILFLASNVFAQETSVFYNGTFDDAKADAAANSKLIIVDVSSDG
ncbi:MAG: hypothetical protein GY863_06965 [bacterium]|nr:hypothetical protein [bacterium]